MKVLLVSINGIYTTEHTHWITHMIEYIKLLRPQQWCKNLFIFLPIFFAQSIGDVDRLLSCCLAFVALCLASSSIYIINDWNDADFDRMHPQKCHRPIASGSVSVRNAFILYSFLIILCAGILVYFFPSQHMILLFGIYLVLNHLYSFVLKYIPLVDIFIVAFNFVLRIIIGATAAAVTPSHWIIIMTFLLALFLVMTKRRDDVVKYEKTGIITRYNITVFNRQFLDLSLTLVAAVTLVSYIMYTVDPEIIQRFDCNYVYSTTIFVLAGILRYLQLTLVDEKGWSPTKIIMHDRFLQLCVVGWLALFAFIIYA